MPTDKESWRLSHKCTTHRRIIMSRITSNMLDQYIGTFNGKAIYFRITQTNLASVNIATHSTKGSESLEPIGYLERTYITGMPHLVTLSKMPSIAFIPIAMGVREKADAFHKNDKLKFKYGR